MTSEQKSASDTDLRIGDFSKVDASGPAVSSVGRGWNGVDAMRFQHAGIDPGTSAPLSRHLLAVHLGRPVDLSVKSDGRVTEAVLSPGSVTIIPADAPSEAHWTEGVVYDTLHLYVDPGLVRNVAEVGGLDPDRAEIVPAVGIRDPEIERTALSLLGEIEAESPVGGKLYAEASANQLAVHLLRRYSSLSQGTARKTARQPIGGLSSLTLRLVTEYIEEHLDQSLSLADLASLTNLSPNHFAILFRRSTSLPPHQYLINRRVERSRLLLSATDTPLAEIAYQAGFTDQAHMTRHVRRLLGTTPGSLRRSARFSS